MSFATLALILLEVKGNKEIQRKILREHSNPLDAPGESHVKFGLHLLVCLYTCLLYRFISHYRLNKDAFGC